MPTNGTRATSSARSRWLAWPLAVLAGAALAAVAIQLARVDAGLGQPFGPDRLVRAMDRDVALAEDDASRARQILRDRPVDGRAYRILAQLASQTSDDPTSHALYDTAISRWPRDRMARAVLAEQAFARDDIDGGLDHIDALLRVAPALRIAVLKALAPDLSSARIREGFAARLARDPPWRAAMTAVLADKASPAQPAEALLAALAARTTLTDAEIAARVTLLDRQGRPRQARQVWLDALPAADRAAAGLVFDGGFERSAVSGGYGWQFAMPAGVSLGYDTGVAYAGDASLLVEFGGRAVRFAGVRQALVLPAGRYRLSVMARNEVDSSRPFLWHVTCSGDARSPLVELPLAPSRQWQSASAVFEVPAACASQVLQLRHASRSMAEQRISGALWIDAVRIIPMR